MTSVYDPVFRCPFFHSRAFKYFQKAKLQLLRTHIEHIIERSCKTFQIFIRQSCYEIEVYVYIPGLAYPAYDAADL